MARNSMDEELPQLPSDEEIVKCCNEQSGVNDSGYLTKYAVYHSGETPLAFIKFGHEDDGMLAEARNQQFAYEALLQQPQEDIRIPMVYRVFSSDGKVYIVMEYIRGKTIGELDKENPRNPHLYECYEKVTRAIKFLLSIPIPVADTTPLGPVGGGLIRHPLFRMATASREYTSIAALQQHVEKVANSRPNNKHKIDFSKEDLCFCFSDLNAENFIRTDSGTVYVIDFGHASFVPTSFMSYALDQPHLMCSQIKQAVQLPKDNLDALKAAAYYFGMGVR